MVQHLRRVAREQVAHAPHDPHRSDLRDRLHDVGVVADDEVDGTDVGGQRIGDLLLRRHHLVHVLVAPVQRHDDQLGARRPGGVGVGEDQRRVDLVDEPLLARRSHEPVEAVGVGQLRDADAAGVVDRRAAGPPVRGRCRRGPGRRRRGRRGWPPRPAPRSRARGWTRPSSRRSRPRPGRWRGPAARGTAGSSTARSSGRASVTSRWQIARSAVGEARRDRRQHRREVVARAGVGGGPHPGVDEDVAAEGEGGAPERRRGGRGGRAASVTRWSSRAARRRRPRPGPPVVVEQHAAAARRRARRRTTRDHGEERRWRGHASRMVARCCGRCPGTR